MKKLAAFLLWGFASGAYATDILLTWTAPTEREDGTAIETIDRFNLYTTVNNVLQDVNEIPANDTSFQLSEVEAGNYTFQISTVEVYDSVGPDILYVEGELSQPITIVVSEKQKASPVRIELTVRVVE